MALDQQDFNGEQAVQIVMDRLRAIAEELALLGQLLERVRDSLQRPAN